jgi:hypothetical protein
MPKIAELRCTHSQCARQRGRVTQYYDSAMARIGIRSTQIVILAELHLPGDSPPTRTELADALENELISLGARLLSIPGDLEQPGSASEIF